MRLAWLKFTRPSTCACVGRVPLWPLPIRSNSSRALIGDLIDPEYPFLAAVAQPGWTFLDFGAAIGQFGVFAAFTAHALIRTEC